MAARNSESQDRVWRRLGGGGAVAPFAPAPLVTTLMVSIHLLIHFSTDLSSSPLLSSITPSLFHSRLKIYLLYADDVILLAPSVHALQLLANICDCELKFLDMAINARKSSCMRFGPRHKSCCADVSVSGFVISWTTSSRYLGVYLESSVKFKCSFAKNKAGFYKAFNSILVKLDATLQRKFFLH